MGEAKRRKHAGITTDTTGRARELRVVLDFIWPGSQAQIARKAQAGDPRAQRCVQAAKLLAIEMQHQRVKCQGCDVHMPTMESLGAVAVTPQAPALIKAGAGRVGGYGVLPGVHSRPGTGPASRA